MTSSPRDSSVGVWRHLLPARLAQLTDSWIRGRLAIVIGVSLLAAVVAALSHLDKNSDFAQLYQAAEIWWRGGDPYSVRAGPFPVFYPFTAVVVALPFSFLPFPDAWFVGIGTAIFLWAITSRSEFRYAWFALIAPAFITTVRLSQWPALMIGGALLPVWGFVLACKPTIGAALWLAFPSKRALVGSVALLVLSIALLPSWPERWLGLLSEGVHFKPPVMFWGGPIILLALLRWRRWDARLLVALACVPQTHFHYETLPLFLIPRRFEHALLLLLSSAAVGLIVPWSTGPMLGWSNRAQYLAEREAMGQWIVLLLYLPCLWMVMTRREPQKRSDG